MEISTRTFFLIILAACAVFSLESFGTDNETVTMNIRRALVQADLQRTVLPDTAVIPLYQGNGRFGSLFGALGLHVNPVRVADFKYGKPQFLHMRHFARAKFGVDYLLPLASIFWEEFSEKITRYSQQQSFYDGTIITAFATVHGKITVTTWFDPIERDLCGIKIKVSGKAPGILLAPAQRIYAHYRQELEQKTSIHNQSGLWEIDLQCLNGQSSLFVQTDAEVSREGDYLSLSLHEGDNAILLSVNEKPQTVAPNSLERTVAWWHSRWENMGCLNLSDPAAQKFWLRTLAHILYSHNDDKIGSAPPMGLTGLAWSFMFPQDLSFLHPLLLSTGNVEIVRSWVEYLAERLPGMKLYTKRIFGVDGVFCPWAVPYAGFEGFHEPAPPTKNYYSIHNSGYLARMAHETGLFVDRSDWKEKYAAPVIRETALFYKSICKKEADGFWHLFVMPSTGQDENGGYNQKDYLCALYSAQYCFQKAVEYGLDDDGFYHRVLQEGLAFPSLLSEKGFYYPNQGWRQETAGGQKHPVQLNELAFLPVNTAPSASAISAYRQRYEITINAGRSHFAGWTLGEFLIAGSRMADSEGWKKDWDNMLHASLADPELIQLYESSANNRCYYITTSGMIAQSMVNNLVDDWFGKLEIASCNPWPGKNQFKNIYSKLGVRVSGEVDDHCVSLHLTAWKDCEFDLHGEKIKMRKGDVKVITRD